MTDPVYYTLAALIVCYFAALVGMYFYFRWESKDWQRRVDRLRHRRNLTR